MTRNATSSFARTFAGAPATVRTRRFCIPASAARLRLVAGGASNTSGRAIGSSCYGLSTAGDAAEFVISHVPSIFCT